MISFSKLVLYYRGDHLPSMEWKEKLNEKLNDFAQSTLASHFPVSSRVNEIVRPTAERRKQIQRLYIDDQKSDCSSSKSGSHFVHSFSMRKSKSYTTIHWGSEIAIIICEMIASNFQSCETKRKWPSNHDAKYIFYPRIPNEWIFRQCERAEWIA